MLLLLALLGSVQFVSSIALRAHAQPGSWVRLVPQALALRIEGIDPKAPLPPALRLVLARSALDAGDPGRAQAYLAQLAPSRDRSALEGRLAVARGDRDGAVQDFLDAGDIADLEEQVDALQARGALDAALRLQHAAVLRLQADPTQADALAQAFFGLGRLEEDKAYRFAVGSAVRHQHEVLAGAAYARAAALAPLEERYALAYANQLLNLARLDDAASAFARARDTDPTSPEPLVGLAEVAHRRGDEQTARAELERARSLDARDPAVVRLGRELGA